MDGMIAIFSLWTHDSATQAYCKGSMICLELYVLDCNTFVSDILEYCNVGRQQYSFDSNYLEKIHIKYIDTNTFYKINNKYKHIKNISYYNYFEIAYTNNI